MSYVCNHLAFQQLYDCVVSHVGNHLSVCSCLTVVLCPISVTIWLSNGCMTVLCPMLVTNCLSAAVWLWFLYVMYVTTCLSNCCMPVLCPMSVYAEDWHKVTAKVDMELQKEASRPGAQAAPRLIIGYCSATCDTLCAMFGHLDCVASCFIEAAEIRFFLLPCGHFYFEQAVVAQVSKDTQYLASILVDKLVQCSCCTYVSH